MHEPSPKRRRNHDHRFFISHASVHDSCFCLLSTFSVILGKIVAKNEGFEEGKQGKIGGFGEEINYFHTHTGRHTHTGNR